MSDYTATPTVNLDVHLHGGDVTPTVKRFHNFVSLDLEAPEGHTVGYYFESEEKVLALANRMLAAVQNMDDAR